MLLARKRGIFGLYICCKRTKLATPADKSSTFQDLLSWLSEGRDHLETSMVLKKMVCMFCEQVLSKKWSPGGYTEDQVFPDGLRSILTYSLPKDTNSLFQQIRTVTKPDSGRVIISFDDAAELLKIRNNMYYCENNKLKAARVNMLRWIRYCISTEVSGDFFWSCPVVFCDSSPEIDKTDPRRRGECVKLGLHVPRVFMPLILHDSFDLFMDKVAETAFEVNTKMAWTEHTKSARYLLELAYYGRPAWGAMTCALLEQQKGNHEAALGLFIKAIYGRAGLVFREMYDFSKIMKKRNSTESKSETISKMDRNLNQRIREATTVLILASVFGVFDIHSTNLNLWFAKRCMSELLALDMDGRVCFSAFPSEPIVASFATELLVGNFGGDDNIPRTVIREAIEFHKHGVISLDCESSFIAQWLLLLSALKSPITEGVKWEQAVSQTSLKYCLPRQARPFLCKLIGESILSKLSNVNDLINGSVIFSHFATVDMDDLVEELGQMGYDREAFQTDRSSYRQLSSYLDAVQLALTVGRLAGRNAAGIVAEPWHGIDLICPIVCRNGQLGCILVSVCGSQSDHKEDTLDSALLDLAVVDPSLLLAAPHPSPKIALPAIGLVFKDISADFSVSFKQLGNAVRVTVSGVDPWMSQLLGRECLTAMSNLWDSSAF